MSLSTFQECLLGYSAFVLFCLSNTCPILTVTILSLTAEAAVKLNSKILFSEHTHTHTNTDSHTHSFNEFICTAPVTLLDTQETLSVSNVHMFLQIGFV